MPAFFIEGTIMAVIDNAFETKGTHLFFVETLSQSDPAVAKVTCPTAIDGINGGSADRINTNCLDNTGKFRTNIPGQADADEISVPFILYKGDIGHQVLKSLHTSGDVVGWMMGLSDSDDYPTLDTDGTLVSPVDRTTFAFQGSISNLTFSAAENEVIRGLMTIRPSGDTTAHWA
jgi:hypothetical protein